MERGKLKIFFGYSAGVGKTYSMLKCAHEMKDVGVDVIIGYVEPHDRQETIKLTEGFEKLPLKNIEYKGITLKEFDVDTAIARNPRLIIVDELAHTNAIGSKHKKRYQDVEDLLENGIDVYTTVNVQHIEGLHDMVDGATSVDVNERIPDDIFDYADEIVLIDIEPADLIERMKEGKIYKQSKVSAALENFFKIEKLSSLRELSMRRSADRIEKKGNNGVLKTKVLVLISPSPSSAKNIRIGARMSEAYHCKFSAMYVEKNGILSNDAAANLKKHMQLVKDMGGELIVKYSEDVVETVAEYVKLNGVTNLIIGKTWQSIGKKVGLEDKFIERLPEIEVLIVPDNQHFNKKKYSVKDIIGLFRKNKLNEKYKIANRILDINKLLAQSSYESDNLIETEEKIAYNLSVAFERSCLISDGKRTVAVWQNENVSLFDGKNELAVCEWCKSYQKLAGKGTDTLREANAIYFPLRTKKRNLAVGFLCDKSKMTISDKLVFNELTPILKILL